MPRRNDIAKILIIGSGLRRLVVFLMLFLFVVVMPSAAPACTRSLATIQVSSDFRVVVSHGSEPIRGIKLEVYDEGESHPDNDGAKQRPILTLLTDGDGSAEIKNLRKGAYLVGTTGPGGGSAVYAVVVEKPDKSSNEILLQWPYSLNEVIKTRSLSGELLSNDPWKPLEDIQVELWAAGFDKPLEVQNSGPQGRFQFDETRPGIYVVRVHGRQRGVDPDNQIEGDISIELSSSARNAMPAIALRLAMSTCGIEYSSCPNSNATIAAASRRVQVRYEPGMSEYPGIENAKYKLLDDHGGLIAEGATDHEGFAHLPSEFMGKATLVVAADSLTTAVQQSLNLLPADPSAPAVVVTMASIGGYEDHCSVVSLENHATQK